MSTQHAGIFCLTALIRSFHVENFRPFRRLGVEHLSRVNLFAGKNNAGKSPLLEALMLYVSDFDPKVMFSVLHGRRCKPGRPRLGGPAWAAAPGWSQEYFP